MGLKKITSLTSLGAALEYYDFVIYATLATYISELFFPAASHSLLQTLAVFAIGYLARPIGGIIFGSFGDRFGRKNVFILSMAMMALSTVAIACLPTYASIGSLASFLLITLRIIQGISFGTELPGAITFLSEHAGNQGRGLHVAFMIFGVSVGALLSSAMHTLLTAFLDHQAMLAYGWRIPFLLGGALAISGYVLRRNSQETPEFDINKTLNNSWEILHALLTQHWRDLLMGIATTLFGGSMIIFYLYLPSYYLPSEQENTALISLAFTIGFFWSACLIPLSGWFADRYGAKKCLIISILCSLICSLPLYALFQAHNWTMLLAFTLIYQSLTAFLAVNYAVFLGELFPTQLRYTGVAICYNTAFALAGFVPILVSLLINVLKS